MLHRTFSGVRMQAQACRVQSLDISAYQLLRHLRQAQAFSDIMVIELMMNACRRIL